MRNASGHLYELRVRSIKLRPIPKFVVLFLSLHLIGFAQVSIDYTPDEVALTWDSSPGQTFDIQTSKDLRDWSAWSKGIQADPYKARTSTTFPTPPGDRRFFRVTFYPGGPRIHRVAWLGDSITAGESNPDGVCHLLTGRLVHTLLRQRITPVANTIRGD